MNIPHFISEQSLAIAPLLALGAINLGVGLAKSIYGANKLSKLHREKFPLLSETAEQKASRLRANEMAQYGFSPEEKAAYQQQLSRSQNTGYQQSVARAPGLSQQILSGINYTNIGAQGDFASRDAALHRQNIAYSDKFSAYLQELNNRNIQQQQQNRLEAERALGAGISDSIGIATQGANQLALGIADGGVGGGDATGALLNPNKNLYGYNAQYNNKDVVDANLLNNNKA